MEKEPGVPRISFSQLARIERGNQEYRQEQLEAIAEALKVTPAQLLEDNPEVESDMTDVKNLLRRVDPGMRQTLLAMIKAAIDP